MHIGSRGKAKEGGTVNHRACNVQTNGLACYNYSVRVCTVIRQLIKPLVSDRNLNRSPFIMKNNETNASRSLQLIKW